MPRTGQSLRHLSPNYQAGAVSRKRTEERRNDSRPDQTNYQFEANFFLVREPRTFTAGRGERIIALPEK